MAVPDPLAGIARTAPAALARVLDGPPDSADAGRLMYWAWWDDRRNFGDWIGPFLYRALTGDLPIHVRPDQVRPPHTVHVTCGSILQKLSQPDTAVVWGSGVIAQDSSFARPAAVHAVRGPFTQAALDRQGYPVPDVIGDPGLCLPLVLDPGPRPVSHRLGLVSHVIDRGFWDKNAEYLPDTVRLIHLDRPIADVVADIVSCEAILSSSLHGIIIAHAYGVPASAAVPCVGRLVGDGVKFRDYYASVGMDFQPADRARISFPFWPAGHVRRAALPDADTADIARTLLDACPFAGAPGARSPASQIPHQWPNDAPGPAESAGLTQS